MPQHSTRERPFELLSTPKYKGEDMVPLASYKIRNEKKMLCLIKVNYTSFSLFFFFVLKLVLTTIYYKRNYVFMVFYYWSKRYKRLKFYPTIMSSTKIVLKDI